VLAAQHGDEVRIAAAELASAQSATMRSDRNQLSPIPVR